MSGRGHRDRCRTPRRALRSCVAQLRALALVAADADVHVVALREDPAVAAADDRELEHHRAARSAASCGKFASSATPCDDLAAQAERACGRAVAAVGADHDARVRPLRRRRSSRSSRTSRTLTPSRTSAPARPPARAGSDRAACAASCTRAARAPCARSRDPVLEAAARAGRRRPRRPARSRTAAAAPRAPVTPPPHGLSRGNVALSTSRTRAPAGRGGRRRSSRQARRRRSRRRTSSRWTSGGGRIRTSVG